MKRLPMRGQEGEGSFRWQSLPVSEMALPYPHARLAAILPDGRIRRPVCVVAAALSPETQGLLCAVGREDQWQGTRLAPWEDVFAVPGRQPWLHVGVPFTPGLHVAIGTCLTGLFVAAPTYTVEVMPKRLFHEHYGPVPYLDALPPGV